MFHLGRLFGWAQLLDAITGSLKHRFCLVEQQVLWVCKVTIRVVPPRNRLTLSGSYQVRMIESPEIRLNNLAKMSAPREGASPWYRRLKSSTLGKEHILKHGDPTDDMSTSSEAAGVRKIAPHTSGESRVTCRSGERRQVSMSRMPIWD